MDGMTPPQTPEQIAGKQREVDCPRCHEQCGWCADYRWHHGEMTLPGSRRKCTLKGIEPEGGNCPLCHGSRRVIATTTYEPVRAILRGEHDR